MYYYAKTGVDSRKITHFGKETSCGISSSKLLLCMIFRTIGNSQINTGAKYQSTVWTGSECGEGSLEVNVPVPARLEVDSISRLILQSCHSGVGGI